MPNEGRVAAIPDTVRKLIQLGFEVMVENGAGAGSDISDEEYLGAGARLVADTELLYASADVVLKVKQPLFNAKLGKHEIDMMKPGTLLIAFLHPAAPGNNSMVKRLRAGKITSLTMDAIPRTLSHAQGMDALTSMSTVTGYRSVLLAAVRLPRFIPMIGTAIGTIQPAKFLIVGAGVVGLQAIATVRRLGGVSVAVDIRPEAREQARSLGAKIGGFEVPEELAIGAGGYAKALPQEWIEREREALIPLVAEADVVISSALVPGERAPVLLDEGMISRMRAGSVVVDVAIDQGGNCELTKAGEEIKFKGVRICGFENIPGGLPHHSTWLYANNIYQFVRMLFNGGAQNPDLSNSIAQSCLVTHAGSIVHAGTLKAMAAFDKESLAQP